jgi:triacylglycerol lipase
MPSVYYQSVGSKMNRTRSGKFPLNIAYPFVRHFDGDNDGLVSVNSAQWGENFIKISINGKRGVSHGDVIDLNRENIRGFDVREFYVSLVEDLKKRGL